MKTPTLHVGIHTLPPEGLAVEATITARELEIPEDERIACPAPFELSLRVSRVKGGILAQGTLSGSLRCRCDRCLTYFTRIIPATPVCHLYPEVKSDFIDLTEDVRDDILLTFPQYGFCRDSCKGLCPGCGENLNVRECTCEKISGGNTAWSSLDQLNLSTDK